MDNVDGGIDHMEGGNCLIIVTEHEMSREKTYINPQAPPYQNEFARLPSLQNPSRPVSWVLTFCSMPGPMYLFSVIHSMQPEP